MIEAATRTVDYSAFAVAGKSLVHGRTGAKIQKILRSPDMILRSRPDSVENGGVNGICVFVHGEESFVRKFAAFSDEIKIVLGELWVVRI